MPYIETVFKELVGSNGTAKVDGSIAARLATSLGAP